MTRRRPHNGLEKLMKRKKLDVVITPFSSFSSILAIGGYPGVIVPAGYEKGISFGIYFGGNDWTTYPDMKVLIDTVLQAFRAQRDIQTSRRGANSITWIKVACPQQRNQIDCGYFMLRFMRDTLALGRLKIPTDYFDEFKCAFYTKDQVDEIKEEWCQFMIKRCLVCCSDVNPT
ncbi:hypothetical protein KIW84_035009 [Lathyrus oleraceus]|uniref:Ubiquitin-like protease family profile domain-containing protein n=1 Tax=Pisum sativum TaxID=3888 RepID=A0A9D4XZX7_PEA|nr:hypothetical protein KIW84_035009 [Pisum sativum]